MCTEDLVAETSLGDKLMSADKYVMEKQRSNHVDCTQVNLKICNADSVWFCRNDKSKYKANACTY